MTEAIERDEAEINAKSTLKQKHANPKNG